MPIAQSERADPVEARPQAATAPSPRGRRILRSPWTWLLAGMAVVLGCAIAYESGTVGFYVQPDELTYVRGAIDISDTGLPLTAHDFWFSSYAQLWPLLLAPAYALLNARDAFGVGHDLQAVLFVSSAIPVFLLARRLVTAPAAVVVALLALLVPWLAMTATMMTEPLAYATFAWALLAMQVALERADVRGDLLALGGIGLAFVTRTQFAVLGAVLIVAIVVHESGWALASGAGARGTAQALVRAVRAHWIVFGLAAVVVLAAIAGVAADTLGAYGGASKRSLLPDQAVGYGRDMLAIAATAVGVLPLALATAWVVLTLVRPSARRLHAYASLAFVLVVGLALASGAFVDNVNANISDRYLMYVVPVLLLGAALLLLDRRPAPLAIGVGVVATALVVSTPAIGKTALSMPSPARTPHVVLQGRFDQVTSTLGLGHIRPGVVLAILAAAACVVLAVLRLRDAVPRLILGAAVAAGLALVMGAQTAYTLNRFEDTQHGANAAYLNGRDWIDQQVGDRKVAVLVGLTLEPGPTTQIFWETTMYNKAADAVYVEKGGNVYLQNFARNFTIDGSGRLRGIEQKPEVVLSQTERRFALEGAKPIKDFNSLRLERVSLPYRTPWTLHASDEQGKVQVGTVGRLRVYGDGRARRRTVTLALTADRQAPDAYVARVRSGGRTLRVRVGPGATRRRAITLAVPATGSAEVDVRVLGRERKSPNPLAGLTVSSVGLRDA